MKKRIDHLPNWAKNLLWFAMWLIIFMIIRNLFPILLVSCPSMEPTLHDGAFVLTSALDESYERGDIIGCWGENEYADVRIVKRVAALPGDEVNVIAETGVVIVNGEVVVDEEHGAPVDPEQLAEFPMIIPEGKLFVLGDNAAVSADSRIKDLGLIPMENVIGVKLFGH